MLRKQNVAATHEEKKSKKKILTTIKQNKGTGQGTELKLE